jgi:hypothetical protein
VVIWQVKPVARSVTLELSVAPIVVSILLVALKILVVMELLCDQSSVTRVI